MLHALGQAHQPLLLVAAVAVLDEGRQQPQGVHLGARCAADPLVDAQQFPQGPALLRVRHLDGCSGGLALDDREVE
jgi:hypothetical protein